MSLKIKLISCISLFMLMLGLVIVGVFAATQTLSITGNVNFVVADKSLYVKEARIKMNNESNEEPLQNFIPGYINGNINLNVGDITNTSGGFSLYFDIINTSDSQWEISGVEISQELQQQSVGVTYSGSVAVGTTTENTQITEDTPIDGTIVITITAPNSSSIDLSGITIMLRTPQTEITAISSNENLGQAQGAFASIGDEVTISADFVGSTDADFLGWSTDIEGSTFISTLPDYTFTYQEDSPTTYYAIFETANTGITYTTSSGEATIASKGVSTSALTDGYVHIPSMIQRDNGTKYIVTEIYNSTSSSNSAFYNVRSILTGITLPETLTIIGDWAFSYCSGLTSVKLPSSVTSIGNYAFRDCDSLTSIEVDIDNKNYASEDGVLFNKDKTKLIQYPIGNIRETYQIPSTVTSIGNYAFYDCRSLASLDLSGCTSLTSIGDSAFNSCDVLTSVKLPSSVTSIGDYAFYLSEKLNLDLSVCTSLESIGEQAFYDCSSLESLDLSGCTSLTSIGNLAFRSCSGLTSVKLPSSLTSIGNSAFYNCSGLTGTLVIPSSVTSIGDSAFSSCDSLTSIEVDIDNKNYASEDGVLFNKDKTELIQYPTGNTRTTYQIPSTVSSIGSDAFSYCSGLTGTLVIPSSVTSIGSDAFSYCSSLESLDLSGCTNLTSIGDNAFYDCSGLESLDLSGCTKLTSIGEWAFYSCRSLKSIKIGATTPPTLGDHAFYTIVLTKIYVPSASVEAYKSASGWSDYSTKISGF